MIIANVPQENLSPKVKRSLEKEVVFGMSGGKNGNELLLKTLKLSPLYMKKNSRLYVVVYSMSDYRETLLEIVRDYKLKMINFYTSPVKDFFYQDMNWYLEKVKNGKISIYKKQSKYWADLFVFELTLKT